ncbi:substrate-binding periplasmic protein [Saccharospirillum mangrovi]|uniref:substrate-binding periplasmic protein n=1 Tax=Saccharospirillum mangrovi TaxID=2161747 RepID=UPI000D34AF9E|nr:transporter substrate-binding domain-containing protein [Saccharospirillum mangrovi]
MKPVLGRWFCLVGLVLLGATLRAESNGLGCEHLVATGNPDYPPYLWRPEPNSPVLVGANQLLLDEISRRLGIPIDVVYTGSWSRAQEEVRAGRVDLIAGAFLTRQRLEYMDYLYPAFFTTRSLVWTRQDQPLAYQKWEDLANWQGITLINNSFGQEFDRYANDHLTLDSVASLDQAMRMLAQGRVDYLLYEEFPAEAYAKRLGLGDQLRSLEPPISQELLYLTLSHRSPCNNGELRGRLSQILTDMLVDGSAQHALAQGLSDWQRSQSQAD